MSDNESTASELSREIHGLQTNFVIVVLIQFVLLIGLVILYMQIAGIPDQTSQQFPQDTSSGDVLSALDPIGANITDLQTQVGTMAARIDAICVALAKSDPAAIAPNACSAP